MSKSNLTRRKLQPQDLISLAANGKLFALVDAHFGPWRKMPFFRLNAKDTDPDLFDVIAWDEVNYRAPFLIQMTEGDLSFIQSHMMTDRWGIFIISSSSLVELGRHFQRFVIARGPDKDPYFFKFQDAAVLEVFLERWEQSQTDIFFGPSDSLGFVDLETLDFTFYNSPFPREAQPLPEECLIHLKEEDLKQCHERIEQDLVKIISWHLRKRHMHLVKGLGLDDLENRVLFGIRKARKYSLETVADLAGFVGLLFEIAPNFDQHPKIKEVLSSHQIPGSAKLDQLIRKVSEKEWREAASLYDDRHWPLALKRKISS